LRSIRKWFGGLVGHTARLETFNGNLMEMKEIETDQERRSLFLRILNRGWLIISFLALISYVIYPAERKLLAFFIVFAIGTYLGVDLLNQGGKTILAGLVFTLLVNFGLMGAFFTTIFLTSVDTALDNYLYILNMMGIAIIFAGAFIHRWAAFSLAALDSTLMLFLTQIIAPQAGPLLSVHIFWWLLASSTWLYESTLSGAFAKLQQARAELELQVVARTLKLQETVNQLEETQQELQAKNEELESFSYSVSHDLRAPLRAIDGYSSVLEADYLEQLPEEGRHILQRVRKNTLRMNQLIQDLLALSRMDRATISRSRVDLPRLVEEVLEELRKENPNQNVEISLEALSSCEADPILLRQVYTNLLSNAFKFTRQRNPAQVNISSQTTPDETIYSVRDNGVGFDMQQYRKLFNPFQRLHSTEKYEGNGIGLSIVRRIVQRHGGKIWAEAVVDQGATFYFTLGEIHHPIQPEERP